MSDQIHNNEVPKSPEASEGFFASLKNAFFPGKKARIVEDAEALTVTPVEYEQGALYLYQHQCPEAKEVADRLGAFKLIHVSTRCSAEDLGYSVETMLLGHEAFKPNDVKLVGEQIVSLAKTFMEHTETDKVRIRLESVLPSKLTDSDFNGKGFHLDKFSERLLCAFTGPGLEWVERAEIDEDAFRSYYKHGQEEEFLHDAPVHKVPENYAVIFKGNELIHRRPHFQGTRMVLFIDREY